MKPCARLSGLCGLAALVAGVVAFSFLATHASASAVDGGEVDLCANEDCGEGTCAVDVDNDIPLCVCKDGLAMLTPPHPSSPLPHLPPCLPPSSPLPCPASKPPSSSRNLQPPQSGIVRLNTWSAPLVRTTVALQQGGSRSIVPASFLAPLPAEQASGSSACGNLYVTIAGTAKISVVWNASNPASPADYAPSSAMCKSLSFYAESGCTKKLRFTVARPAKKGSSYPVTIKTVKGIRSLLSVGCEITMCENDCGSAKCVVKEGQPQCQCPEGLVFNAAKKLCRDPSLAPRRRP
ncbi:unnamed protein product [Closterium sp. Naga37s-1]|nr:unnamed protein product [Closterium sp. Naga37s-1]